MNDSMETLSDSTFLTEKDGSHSQPPTEKQLQDILREIFFATLDEMHQQVEDTFKAVMDADRDFLNERAALLECRVYRSEYPRLRRQWERLRRTKHPDFIIESWFLHRTKAKAWLERRERLITKDFAERLNKLDEGSVGEDVIRDWRLGGEAKKIPMSEDSLLPASFKYPEVDPLILRIILSVKTLYLRARYEDGRHYKGSKRVWRPFGSSG